MTNKRNSLDHAGHLLDTKALFIARVPILLWVVLVTVATCILQWTVKPLLISSIVFLMMMSLHVTLHWFSHLLVKSRPWLYFFWQALLIYSCAYLMPDGFVAILIGLYPALIGQSVGVYYKRREVLIVSLFSYSLFCVAVGFVSKWDNLKMYIPILILMMVIVVAYAVLFFQQVHTRIRTQAFLRELELAHRKVEELTLANERQRIARDLHDTLAQGLAGVIMKLEAVDAHMSNGNVNRAHQIILLSMSQARKTLSDARGAIDDLRSTSLSEKDFTEAIRDEVHRFKHATGIEVSLEVKLSHSLPLLWKEHSLYIISECLTNIARHAHAKQVSVLLLNNQNVLQIKVQDDGNGFNIDLIGKQPGHYGLIGISERVRILGGRLGMISKEYEGTLIDIEAPLIKGDQNDA